jgi:hypothetical protein
MDELPAAGVVRVAGPDGAGTGFLVSGNGLIVTCAHVIAGAAPGATVMAEPHHRAAVGRRLPERHHVISVRVGGTIPDLDRMEPVRARPGLPRHLPVNAQPASSTSFPRT